MRRLVPVVLAMLATLAVAVPAQAAEPHVVDVFGCDAFEDGKALVPRRTDIDLRISWGSATRRQGLKFLESVRPVVKIDGAELAHPNQYWDVPIYNGSLWDTVWTYPAGQLASGESFLVKMQLKLREPVWDGFVRWEAGNVFEAALECKVKAPRA